jgi:hypothetical protein
LDIGLDRSALATPGGWLAGWARLAGWLGWLLSWLLAASWSACETGKSRSAVKEEKEKETFSFLLLEEKLNGNYLLYWREPE